MPRQGFSVSCSLMFAKHVLTCIQIMPRQGFSVSCSSEVEVMSIHDRTWVPAGIFHDFHHEWISTIKRFLSSGLLPAAWLWPRRRPRSASPPLPNWTSMPNGAAASLCVTRAAIAWWPCWRTSRRASNDCFGNGRSPPALPPGVEPWGRASLAASGPGHFGNSAPTLRSIGPDRL
jgi:hypothetical protein